MESRTLPSEDGAQTGGNSFLNWDWQASDRYGGQRINLRDWQGGIRAARNRPNRQNVCGTCRNFDVTAAIHTTSTRHSDRYARWDRRTSHAELLETAEGGCTRCEALVQAVERFGTTPEWPLGNLKLRFLPTSVAILTDSKFLEVFPADGERHGACGFPSNVGPGRSRYSSPLDDDLIGSIIGGINECILHHSECRSATGHMQPKRLVRIPSKIGRDVKVISAPPDAEYVALSHCWGKKPLKRLLKEHGTGDVIFSWNELPQSFQDACILSRRLFQRYIWIDSLCIVQDDADDWRTEAAKMGRIYAGAYTTISATDADASVNGFLHPRFDSHDFTSCDRRGRHVRFCVRDYDLFRTNGRMPHYGDTESHPFLLRANDLDAKYLNPLQLRGWCFQERLLSSRVLHMKRDEVVLECNRGYRCECSGLSELQDGTMKRYLSLMLKSKLDNPELLVLNQLQTSILLEQNQPQTTIRPVPPNIEERFTYCWETLVEAYSRTTFTKSEDVLPALGSLARLFYHRHPHSNYVAGLWSHSLGHDLLWTPHAARGDDGRSAVRKFEPCSPGLHELSFPVARSWSWSSISGRVSFLKESLEGKQAFELLATTMTMKGSDPYGDIPSGRLRLRGRVVAFGFWKYNLHHSQRAPDDAHVGPTITVFNGPVDDWASCSKARQDVEVCRDITAEGWTWKKTSEAQSGIEENERLTGFDDNSEMEDFFNPDGIPSDDEESEKDAEDEDEEDDDEERYESSSNPSTDYKPNEPRIQIQEPLFAFRITSGCSFRGQAKVGAAVLLLRREKQKSDLFRRVGARVVRDSIFDKATELDIVIK